MTKTKNTKQQVAIALKQEEPRSRVAEVCDKNNISEVTIYNRKKKN